MSRVENYTLYYISRGTKTHDAEIDLFLKGRRVGILYFYRKGKDIPADKMTINGAYLHFRLDRFEDVHRVLQTEQPVYVRFDETRGYGYLQTGWEPTGEEES